MPAKRVKSLLYPGQRKHRHHRSKRAMKGLVRNQYERLHRATRKKEIEELRLKEYGE